MQSNNLSCYPCPFFPTETGLNAPGLHPLYIGHFFNHTSDPLPHLARNHLCKKQSEISLKKREKSPSFFHPFSKGMRLLAVAIQNGLTFLTSPFILPVAKAETLDCHSQLQEAKNEQQALETHSCIIRGRLEKIETPTCASMTLETSLNGKLQSAVQTIWKKDLAAECAPLVSHPSIDSLIDSLSKMDPCFFSLKESQCAQVIEKGHCAYIFIKEVKKTMERLQCFRNGLNPIADGKLNANNDAECEENAPVPLLIQPEKKPSSFRFLYGGTSFIVGFFFSALITKAVEKWTSKEGSTPSLPHATQAPLLEIQ